MSRRAELRTRHEAPGVLAAALRPDHTDAMGSRVEDGTLVTTIERPTAAGLRSTVDDYVVNLRVATAVADAVRSIDDGSDTTAGHGRTDETDTTPNTRP